MSKENRPEHSGTLRRLCGMLPRLRLKNCLLALAGSAILAFGL